MGGWAARWLTPSSPRPFPAESLDRLVRQLSEVFGAEAAAQEPGPASPDEEPVVEEPARRSSPPAVAPGEEAERPPSPSAAPARPGRLAGPGFSSGKCVCGGVPRVKLRVPGERRGPWDEQVDALRCVGLLLAPVLTETLSVPPPPRFGCPPSPRAAWPWGSAAGRPGGPPLGTVLLSNRFLARS